MIDCNNAEKGEATMGSIIENLENLGIIIFFAVCLVLQIGGIIFLLLQLRAMQKASREDILRIEIQLETIFIEDALKQLLSLEEKGRQMSNKVVEDINYLLSIMERDGIQGEFIKLDSRYDIGLDLKSTYSVLKTLKIFSSAFEAMETSLATLRTLGTEENVLESFSRRLESLTLFKGSFPRWIEKLERYIEQNIGSDV